MKNRIVVVTLLVLTVSFVAGAGEPGDKNMFWGGWFGAGFGTVDFVELSPTVGFYPMDKLAAGLRLTYRYRKDSRYSPSFSTSDYGGGLFLRYHLIPQLFVQAEYDYLNYEYFTLGGNTERANHNGLLGGGGFSQPLGDHVALNFSVLYDFLYDSNDLYSSYNSPWVYRVGIGVGF